MSAKQTTSRQRSTGPAPDVAQRGPAEAPPHRLAGVPDALDAGADLFDYGQIRDVIGFVLRAPRRNRALALACFLGVLALALLALWAFPKSYHVETHLLAQRNQVMASLSNPWQPRSTEADAPTRAARETVLRWDNLVALIQETDLVNRWERSRAPAVRLRDAVTRLLRGRDRTKEETIEALVHTLEKQMRVDVGEGTVTIAVDWPDADTAFRLTEAAQQSFLETRHTTEISIVGDAIAILEAHGTRVLRELNSTVEKLAEKERVLRGRPAPLRRVPQLRPEVTSDPEVAHLRTTLNAKLRALSDLQEFRNRRLEDLQAQLGQQQAIYADQHPAVVTIRQSIEALRAPSPQMEGLRSEVRELERDIVRRGGQVREVQSEVMQPPAIRSEVAEARVSKLEAEDPTVEYERSKLRLLFNKYGNLVERIDAAKVEMDTLQAAFKYRYSVLSPPQVPKTPAKPNALLVIAGGLVGGLALALFAAALADVRSGRIVEGWQVERRLDLPILAQLRR